MACREPGLTRLAVIGMPFDYRDAMELKARG
jgi:hypothetical protein